MNTSANNQLPATHIHGAVLFCGLTNNLRMNNIIFDVIGNYKETTLINNTLT